MTATNSGSVAAPGFTYANAFLFYGRDESKGPDGETIATGTNSVLMDMNTFAWASEPIAALSGLRFSLAATIPIANNSLASDVSGSISGGGGLADSYYQPVILGWAFGRADLRAAYGFLAPTGRFHAGASDNVGSGYWTHTLSLGETVYLTGDRATALSAYQIYEFHTTQEGTGIHPGQTLSLDYSLTQKIALRKDMQLQVGLAGYGQWQTTGRSGPDRDARRDGSALPCQRARTGRQRTLARPQGQPRRQVPQGILESFDVPGVLDPDFRFPQSLVREPREGRPTDFGLTWVGGSRTERARERSE